jgi:hypothetical protein
MKIGRQFSQVLKTSSREKRCGARSWQPKATRSQKRQETFHPVCYINLSWYSNMNWQTNVLNEKGGITDLQYHNRLANFSTVPYKAAAAMTCWQLHSTCTLKNQH